MTAKKALKKYKDSAAKSKKSTQKSKSSSSASSKTGRKIAAKSKAQAPKKTKSVTKKETIKEAIETREAAAKSVTHEKIAKHVIQKAIPPKRSGSSLVREDFSPLNSDREKLIREYAPLIRYIAQKIAARLPSNIELDDLISSGVIGLMDAIEKYDASRDNKFKTYAEFRIRGSILDELRSQDWVPRSVREKAKALERVYSKIEQDRGRQATDDEICEEMNITKEDYQDLLNQVRSVSLISYDDVSNFSRADKKTLHGYEDGMSKASNPYSAVTIAQLKKMVSDAITDLPEKQRLVLSLYYYEDLNLKEIGRVLDVTESRVSQLHTQGILRLKSKLRNRWDEFSSLFG